MKDDDNDFRTRVALFRYGLISDLARLPKGAPGLQLKLQDKAAQDYEIPGTLRTRVAAETMRGWLRKYREGGFDALLPKPRHDIGKARSIPQPVADLLCAIKEDRRELSVPTVINVARASGDVPADLALAASTVHRLLVRNGLMKRRADENSPKDRRRFSYEKAGDLWMSDVMHGPAVVTEGKRKRKAYLIAFIDDATRIVPHAEFALSENTQAFMPVLKQAVLRRGIPKRLYVDNGSAYRSKHLSLVAAKVGITLIHTRARDPAAKGKQERWFRTCRMQLLPLLTKDDLSSLGALNRRLRTWIESEYHQAPHRGLDGDTPFDRWAAAADEVRYPGPEDDLDDLFLFEAKRRVQKDRTASLEGVVYEVDATLVGETVTLRYDPSKLRRPVQVWHRGRYVHEAKVVDAYSNCYAKRDRHGRKTSCSTDDSPPKGIDLSKLARDGKENN